MMRDEIQEIPRSLSRATKVFFSYPSPVLFTVIAVIAVGVRVSMGNFRVWDLVAVLLPVLSWPLVEWMIHVFVLHFKPREVFGISVDSFAGLQHRRHHRDPRDMEFLFVPVRAIIPGVPVFVLIAYVFMPTPELCATNFAALVLLSLHYEWCHFLAHTRYQARTSYYRRIFRHHMWHHYKNERYWMGVSMTLGDSILGTSAVPSEVEKSETCRTLGYDDPHPDPAL